MRKVSVKTLSSIPGIGPKSAQRIILELKDKIKKEQQIGELNKVSNNISGKTKMQEAIENDEKISEAATALQVLGYNRKEIEKIFVKISNKAELSTEELIKKGLNLLSSN